MAEKIIVRKVASGLWQWRDVAGQGDWRSNSFYTGDINLLKESIDGKAVWLVLPGQSIVSQQVTTEISDRRQLAKILPFEVEENIIDPIEDLHFAFGPLRERRIAVAYGDAEWMQSAVMEIEGTGAEVDRVTVDYALLPGPDDGWVLLLENGQLMAHIAPGVGFAVEIEAAALYLAALSASGQPGQIQLFADTEEGLDLLRAALPEAWADRSSILIEESEAGFWDLVRPDQAGPFNFRGGRLARKLPLTKWWQDWKTPVIAIAAAFLVALGVTWLGLMEVDRQRKEITKQTDEIFRQVVPTGSISDPERQLRGLLGKSGSSVGASNLMSILAGVAPAIGEFDQVRIRNFRYSSENRQLQLNIEADSFATFESLRNKIAEAGLTVDIRSANVQGDTHQAQLRVSEAG